MIEIIDGHEPECIETARTLFLEYADSLGFDLCFQGFQKELAELPGAYAPPGGRLLLARDAQDFAGCVAVRPIGNPAEKVCEMKRLYVRPTFRGKHVGRALVVRLLSDARIAGYTRMYLDTLETMIPAMTLYRSVGFQECQPYSYHPVAGTKCFDLQL